MAGPFPSWDPNGATWGTVLLDEEFPGAALSSIWQAGWFAAAGTSGPVNSQETDTYASAHVSVAAGLCSLLLSGQGAIITSNPANGGGAAGFTFTAPFAYEWRVWLPGSAGASASTGTTGLAGASGTVANWPAVWSTGQHWPTTREIDCMEGLGGQAAGHFIDGSTAPAFPGFFDGTTPGWHTFGVTLVNSKLSFYYDGALMGASPYTTSSDNSPHYLVADNTQGGPGGPSAQPRTLQIDWVRVWAPGTSGGATGGGGSTGGGATGGQPGGLSVVQTATLPVAQFTSNPATVTLPQPTVAGNCLVACVGYGIGTAGDTVTGIVSGAAVLAAENWARLVNVQSPTRFQNCEIWADPSCAGGQTSVKVTLSATADEVDVVVYEVFGAVAAAPLDQSSTGNGTGTAFASGNVANTGTVPELAIGVASIFNAFAAGGLPGAPWTSVEPIGDLVNMCAGYQVIQPGAAASFAGTQDASGTWSAAAVTLKSAQTAASGSGPGTRPGRSLLVSLAPAAGVDGYGNPYPAGLQVGAATAAQVAIVPNSAGGAAEVQFPLPVPLSNVPNLAAGLAGAFGALLLSGPAVPAGGVGDDDWCQVVLWTDGSGVRAARGELRYVASGGAVTVVAQWDDLGFQIPARAVAPAAPASGCLIYYSGGKLIAKGPSGVAVTLATT